MERNFVSEILTFIFDMERVLLQPANSLLQPAKKSKDLNKVLLLLQDLGLDSVIHVRIEKYFQNFGASWQNSAKR